VLRPSRASSLDVGMQALGTGGGQLIAVLGDVAPAQARELAAARRGTAPGVALLLAEAGAANVASSAQVLAGAGWRVAVVPDAARLAAAWQELYRAGASAGAPSVWAPAAAAPPDDSPATPAGAPAGEASHG
jgi:hypothetical protein